MKGSSWNPWELEAVVPLLQSLDPPGIGARYLRECLLLQQDQPQSLSAILIREYLEDLAYCIGVDAKAKHNGELLLQKLKNSRKIPLDTTLETLQAAIYHIQSLEPRPARNFGFSSAVLVTPDLKAEYVSREWRVSLVYEASQRFCLNQEAIKLLEQQNLRNANILKEPQRHGDHKKIGECISYQQVFQHRQEDIQQLASLLQKARNLLTALEQWQENLLNVGQFLVERQQVFLNSRDAIDLLPTPQQIVAQAVGLSNATVSRIVRERYLLVGNQHSRIIPLSSLCVPVTVGGRTPQQMQQLIVDLINDEPHDQPYSDQQLAQLLKLRFGLAIARRTVSKYRNSVGIKSAYARRRCAEVKD